MALDPVLQQALAAHLRYFRDLGVYDFYRRREAIDGDEGSAVPEQVDAPRTAPPIPVTDENPPGMPRTAPRIAPLVQSISAFTPISPALHATALEAIREEIGDCQRCTLAPTRNKIVFGDGDPNARLMFVGEGPGADEDEQGLPFVGRGGQLLNNMIGAMGLKREQVYIANIVKCRPPKNRVPEPAEANTCKSFLFQQIEVVRPELIVALGSTAATYLLGVKTSLGSLRGRLHQAFNTRLIFTYHPAFLLRDPTHKKEAWKDLQMAMNQLGLKPKREG